MGRPRSDIQPRILRAARARFLVDGVDGASLRKIARDARTSIGMVFYYYPTKDALFLAVVEETYATLVQDLERVLSGRASVRSRLLRAFVRIGNASDDETDVVRLIVREALVSSDRLRSVLARFRTGHVATLLRTLAEGVERGEIDEGLPLPVLLAATVGIAGMPQVIRRVAGGDGPFGALPGADALGETALAILFDGIGKRAQPSVAQRKPVIRRRARR